MRIAILGPFPTHSNEPVGGVQAAVVSLAEALSEEGGHEVCVFDPFTGNADVRVDGFEVKRLGRWSTWRAALTSAPEELSMALGRFSADVLHVHLGAQYTHTHPRSVLTVHGFPHFESRLRNPGLRGRVAAHALRRAFLSGFRRAGRVIAISDEVAQLARREGVEHVRIPNPINRCFFESTRTPGPDFVAVGDIMRRKNQRFLIESFGQYVNSGGDGDLLVVGGVGDASYFDECREAAGALSERVRFLGPRKHSEVAELLAGARASVSMSLRETSSIALAEALAANCPVVSLDVGTAREQVVDEHAGIVLPVDASPGAVTDALTRVGASNHDGRELRDIVMGQHPAEVARRTVEVYEAVLAEGERNRA